MADSIERFEAFWREMDLGESQRYVHPADAQFVDPGPAGDTQLQLHVLPIPANGNLRTAEVVIFALNPNFDESSHAAWEKQNKPEAELMDLAQRSNIRQFHRPGDCAFYDIDPGLSSHPGAKYWRGDGKFGGIAKALALKRSVSLDHAYRLIGQRVAVVQMVPYRSKKFGHHKLIGRAPSSIEAVKLAQHLAKDSDKLLIVQRQVAQWGFTFPSKLKHVITYDPQREALKASLSLSSRGGPALLQRLVSSQ